MTRWYVRVSDERFVREFEMRLGMVKSKYMGRGASGLFRRERAERVLGADANLGRICMLGGEDKVDINRG